jgi:hypothetical protein
MRNNSLSKLKTQKIGIHNLCFHTALESDYAQIISQVDQSSFMLKDLRSPTDKIDFDYFIIKPKQLLNSDKHYILTINTQPSSIDISYNI